MCTHYKTGQKCSQSLPFLPVCESRTDKSYSVTLHRYSFLARLFEEKKVELLSLRHLRQRLESVKFFVKVHFSKTIKGIHLKLGILVHYQKKRNQLQLGR
jgi:hypothetical protein